MQSQPKRKWSDVSLDGLDGILEDETETAEIIEVVDDYCKEAFSGSKTSQEIASLYERLERTELLYREALSKLESATYRIGYLDAQVASQIEQLKLLTADKGYLPRWCRWRNWFMSERKERSD